MIIAMILNNKCNERLNVRKVGTEGGRGQAAGQYFGFRCLNKV